MVRTRGTLRKNIRLKWSGKSWMPYQTKRNYHKLKSKSQGINLRPYVWGK